MDASKSYRVYENVLRTMTLWAVRLGSVILILMMLLVFADVFLRYLFNRPIAGSVEIVEIMMAMVIALGMGYTGIVKGHISVELLVSHFPPKGQAVLDVFHCLIAAVMFFVMCWKTGDQALVVGSRHVTTTVLEIPIYPFVWVLSLCAGLLGLVFLLQFFEAISQVVKKWVP